MNRVGRYAAGDEVDEIKLLNMVFELSEKERMLMWSEGYIHLVIEKLPSYAKDILESSVRKWENTKEFVFDELERITHELEFIEKIMSGRKEFALHCLKHYPEYQSLLFLIYDGNLKEADLRKYVYRRKFGLRKKYI